MHKMGKFFKEILAISHEIQGISKRYSMTKEEVLSNLIDALDMERPEDGKGIIETYAGVYKTQFLPDDRRRITIPSMAPMVPTYKVFVSHDGIVRLVPLSPRECPPIEVVD